MLKLFDVFGEEFFGFGDDLKDDGSCSLSNLSFVAEVLDLWDHGRIKERDSLRWLSVVGGCKLEGSLVIVVLHVVADCLIDLRLGIQLGDFLLQDSSKLIDHLKEDELLVFWLLNSLLIA